MRKVLIVGLLVSGCLGGSSGGGGSSLPGTNTYDGQWTRTGSARSASSAAGTVSISGNTVFLWNGCQAQMTTNGDGSRAIPRTQCDGLNALARGTEVIASGRVEESFGRVVVQLDGTSEYLAPDFSIRMEQFAATFRAP